MNAQTKVIAPFENESEVVEVCGLTIENRFDHVAVYGSVDLTRDKAGLAAARLLKANVDAIVAGLDRCEDLPQQVQRMPGQAVENPFGSGSN